MRIRRNRTLMQQAADYVEAAVEKAGPVLAEARDRAEAALADAREQAGPVLAEAKAKAGPTLADARDRATPLIAQGAAMAAEKASAAADLAAEKAAQGKELAATKASELAGRPQKKHRLRKLLILSGLAAVIGFAAKKLQSRGDRANWQSSYTPTPPPPPTTAAGTETPIADAAAAASVEGADEGGAAPGEALADAADESHDVTTPDEPADIVDLEPGQEPVAKKSAKP
jgi:hypothetical protein